MIENAKLQEVLSHKRWQQSTIFLINYNTMLLDSKNTSTGDTTDRTFFKQVYPSSPFAKYVCIISVNC